MLNVLRWSVHGGGRAPDPFDVQRHTAFLGRAGSGRDQDRVPQHGFHAGAPARRPVRRMAHDGRARRALPARGRGRRATRVRVLPRGRFDRARVRPARARLSARARGGRRARRCAARRAAGARRAARDRRPRPGAPRARVVDRDARARRADDRDGRRRSLPLPLRAQGRGARAARRGARPAGRARGCGRAPRCSTRGCSERARREAFPVGSATSCSRRATVAFVDPALPNEVQLRSGHGSLTPDEMLVPLVAAPAAPRPTPNLVTANLAGRPPRAANGRIAGETLAFRGRPAVG